jgi:hypothetical protein
MVKVAQCWDDGVATDIRLIEILRKYNAKATFNLCPGRFQAERIEAHWRDTPGREWSIRGFTGGLVGKNELLKVYDDFQVASHCWCHETVGRGVSDADFLKAAVDARNFLEDLFQRECRGFAWPCGQHSPETEHMLEEAGFRYGRTTGNVADVTACANPLALDSNCHFMNTSFWKIFEDAKPTGVFYFWGHSYEMMDCPQFWSRFELMIKTLSEDPDVEWVDVIDLVPLCKRKK